MAYCLKRDKGWVQASRGALAPVKYRKEGSVHPTVSHERKAFDAGRMDQFPEAVAEMQRAVNGASDDRHRGWLKQELATYTNPLSATEAQNIQKSALSLNVNLFRPLVGISYVKLKPEQREQAARCMQYYTDRFETPNHMIVTANDLLDKLVFAPETATAFESAFRDLGLLLGHGAHRPESDFGRGPDILWNVGALSFFVVEAKNGATTDTISKRDANQLSGSINWFAQQYGVGVKAIPILIHPSRRTGPAAHPDTRVILKEHLSRIRSAVRHFVTGVSAAGLPYRAEIIAPLLTEHNLTPNAFVQTYTVGVVRTTRITLAKVKEPYNTKLRRPAARVFCVLSALALYCC